MGLYQLVERVERASSLDAAATATQGFAQRVLAPGPVKNALCGTWLGHPLHPLLVAVPIGSWLDATALDLVGGPGSRRTAQRLIGIGVLAALPTAVAGVADWTDTADAERRVGFVHAAGNAVAIALFGASWWARRRHRRGAGVALALAGNGVLVLTGHLGGHLSYSLGVGVDTTAFLGGPTEWAEVAPSSAVVANRPTAVEVGGTALLLVRQGGTLHALHDRCTHRGGPLHEGELGPGCITCPWHDSRFGLEDGAVQQGPATAPQAVFETREVDGRIEVRRLEVRGLRTAPA